MYTQTKIKSYTKARTTNSTSSSITAPSPTITTPSGEGVVDLDAEGHGRSEGPNFAELVFFGAGTAGTSGSAKVYLWHRCGTLFIPVQILDLTLTLSTTTGVDGASVDDSDKFVDSIVAGEAGQSQAQVFSPSNNLIAKVDVDLQGAKFLEVRFAKGTTTSLNALARGY